MVRLKISRALTVVVLLAATSPALAAEAYQVATISSLLAGGYDGDTTVGEILRHGDFGLGTFNGVDGEFGELFPVDPSAEGIVEGNVVEHYQGAAGGSGERAGSR